MERLQIDFEIIELVSEGSFERASLSAMMRQGFDLPGQHDTRSIAEHIRDNLGFNKCQLFHLGPDGKSMIFTHYEHSKHN